MPGKSRIKVTQSTGNVFRDLGFPAEAAEHAAHLDRFLD
jgi:hypothetical protein